MHAGIEKSLLVSKRSHGLNVVIGGQQMSKSKNLVQTCTLLRRRTLLFSEAVNGHLRLTEVKAPKTLQTR